MNDAIKILGPILKEYLIPHSAEIIGKVALFGFLGFVLSIVLIIIYWRKGVFKRIPKFYNYIVKLYIPILFFGCIWFMGSWGFLKSVSNILKADCVPLSAAIWDMSLGQILQGDEDKIAFVEAIHELANVIESGDAMLEDLISAKMNAYKMDNVIVDKSFHAVTDYIVDEYGEEIGTYAMYGLYAASTGGISKHGPEVGFDEFKGAIDALRKVKYIDIKGKTQETVTNGLVGIVDSQYKTFLVPVILFLLMVILFPLMEFLIYKKWIEPKYLVEEVKIDDVSLSEE